MQAQGFALHNIVCDGVRARGLSRQARAEICGWLILWCMGDSMFVCVCVCGCASVWWDVGSTRCADVHRQAPTDIIVKALGYRYKTIWQPAMGNYCICSRAAATSAVWSEETTSKLAIAADDAPARALSLFNRIWQRTTRNAFSYANVWYL